MYLQWTVDTVANISVGASKFHTFAYNECIYAIIFFFITNSVCAHMNDQSKPKELQDLATQLLNLIMPTGTVYMYTSMC